MVFISDFPRSSAFYLTSSSAWLYELYHLPYELSKKAAATRKYRVSIPKALPLKRRRLFSFEEAPRSVSNALFLNKLPLYKYVLGGQLLHIVHRSKRLAHMFCCTKVPYSALFFNPDHENISCSFTSQRAIICDTILRPRNTKQCSYRRQQYLALPPTPDQLLGLLRACRQTYHWSALFFQHFHRGQFRWIHLVLAVGYSRASTDGSNPTDELYPP